MNLTQKEKILVNESFLKAAMKFGESTDTFYERLFEIAPETRPLFKGTNMREQGSRLMRMLDMTVETLHKPDVFMSQMEALGQRHIAYGVSQEHYKPFGEALIWMLEHVLKDEFTPDTREAWIKAFDYMAEVATAK